MSNLTGLSGSTVYYVRAYATNTLGTSYGNEVTFTNAYYIGLSYGGGIIFYNISTGQHGLISAASDQSSSAEWGCYGTAIPGGTSTDFGTGQANTTTIVTGCSERGIAARICDDLVLNGHSDWYLPSKAELNMMFQQRTLIGGFAEELYWSSSECSSVDAWLQYFFSDGNQVNVDKTYYPVFVRAIRAF